LTLPALCVPRAGSQLIVTFLTNFVNGDQHFVSFVLLSAFSGQFAESCLTIVATVNVYGCGTELGAAFV
jgi:hypothetical protein